jgi:O-antigen ligase
MLTALGMPFCLYFLLEGGRETWERLLAGALLLAGVCNLLLTASRASTLAAMVGCGLFLALWSWWRLLAGVLAVALVTAILIGYGVDPIQTFHLEHLVRAETLATGAGRLQLWWVAWYFFLKSPILGHGFASGWNLLNESAVGVVYAPGGSGRWESTYAGLLVDTGAVGFVPFILFLALTGVRALGRFFQIRDRHLRFLILGMLGVFASGLVHAVFENWFFSAGSVGTILWWSMVTVLLCVVWRPGLFQERSG